MPNTAPSARSTSYRTTGTSSTHTVRDDDTKSLDTGRSSASFTSLTTRTIGLASCPPATTDAADTPSVPQLERVREIALLLGVADPQGLISRGVTPVDAYGVEAYSIALLEEKRAQVTAPMVVAIFDFWYSPRPGWALGSERELDAFISTISASRP